MKNKQEILNLVEKLPQELQEKFQDNLSQLNQQHMKMQDLEASKKQEMPMNQTQNETQMKPMKSGSSSSIAERFKNMFSRKKKK
jgi:hypothetical protein